jgi:hypothetical protein
VKLEESESALHGTKQKVTESYCCRLRVMTVLKSVCSYLRMQSVRAVASVPE